MKRLLSALLLTGCLSTTVILERSPLAPVAIAQTQPSQELFYTFYGQQIPLTLRQNVVAVKFHPPSTSRSRGTVPLYQQLQLDLSGEARGTRGEARGGSSPVRLEVEVQPLGDRYALVSIPANLANNPVVEQQIRQQTYVEETLPVLATVSSDPNTDSAPIVLPNEIIVSFEAGLSNSQIQVLLNRHNLDIIRPLQFTQNRYLVRSRRDRGTAILDVANRLNGVTGIQAATPNFIQSLAYGMNQQEGLDTLRADLVSPPVQELLASLPTLETRFSSNLLPLAWHLNSTPQRGSFLPRTDVRATEAWEQSNGGAGVVVAIIDSLIQWDHSNLKQNLYTVSDRPDRLPDETHGWDFTSNQTVCSRSQPEVCVTGDADTRISQDEIVAVRSHFQNTFRLSDEELLQQYESFANQLRSGDGGNVSDAELADAIRMIIRSDIASEFHGTWSAGVIAAQPQDGQGAVGVAPKSQILPVRVFGLGGEITSARLVEAIGYAADRGADVINLSLGGMMPDQAIADQIFQVLDAHPKLAIVASAGNDSVDGVAFPAAIPGVISVGATNMEGRRSSYSTYGGQLDVVAPGGETMLAQRGGILTTGGTWVEDLWQGMTKPNSGWALALDPLGKYVQVQGTSFSAPTVAGVVALMKDVNPNLRRDRISAILEETASYTPLSLSQAEQNRYRLQSQLGMTLMQDRLSGVFPMPQPISAEQYFFGRGLVNAEAAVRQAKR